MQTRLPYKREVFRLWFEFLRLARQSNDANIINALRKTKTFYAPWGAVETLTFNDWWKLKGSMFEEAHSVKEVDINSLPTDPDILLVQIPLNQSLTKLTGKVRKIIKEASKRRGEKMPSRMKAGTNTYRLSEGAEPKLAAIREMLNVYRDVHLKNKDLRGEPLLRQAQNYYKRRKNKKWAKVPYSLNDGDGDKIRAMRNLRRYIQRAKKITLNVANGSFPGKY